MGCVRQLRDFILTYKSLSIIRVYFAVIRGKVKTLSRDGIYKRTPEKSLQREKKEISNRSVPFLG